MPDVVLVDDHPAFGDQHRQVFGDGVHWCRSASQLAADLDSGTQWTTAFVDFDLGRGQQTGLTAMTLLAKHSPQTRAIAYTSLSDNGRTLFAVAAYRWFGCTSVLDKSLGDAGTLRAAAAGANPTPPAWRNRLHHSAHLIDELFQEPSWTALWRVWPDVNGSMRAVRDALPGHTPYSIGQFAKLALPAMENFESAFLGRQRLPVDRGNTARATPLARFAHSHDAFFRAPDLGLALDHGKPWERRA